MRFIIFTAAFIGLAVLGVKGLYTAAPEIEHRLESKVVLNLAEEGNSWADADISGREVHLTGSTDNVSTAERAINAIKNLWGVNNVTSNIQIDDTQLSEKAYQAPYSLTVVKTPSAVKIAGSVGSEESKERLIRIAETNYGAEFVEEHLSVQAGAPAGWRSAAGSIIFNIGQFESATAELTESGLTLNGETVEESFGEFAQKKISQALPDGYQTAFNIEVMNIEPAAGPEENFVERLLGSSHKEKHTCDAFVENAKKNLQFSFDSSMIKDTDKPQLKELASNMATCAEKDLVIHGHTDSTGTSLYNQWLSEQRALSGKRYLMTQGVRKDRISTIGHSENTPTVSNATTEGRALNRRIEFKPTINNQ